MAKPNAKSVSRTVKRNKVDVPGDVYALATMVMAAPIPYPTNPPIKPIKVASMRNSPMMLSVVAPTAFFRPISRTRSATAMNIVLTTDRPPMTSASSAAAVVMAVKIAPPDLKLLTMTLGLVAFTPVTCALMRSAIPSRSLIDEPGLP